MSQELKKRIQTTLDQVKGMAEKGWKATFGEKGYEVSSIKQAQQLPEESSIKLEAVAYWENVDLIYKDIARYLEKAIKALDQGDLKGVKDSVYYAKYIEQPFHSFVDPCKKLYQSLD